MTCIKCGDEIALAEPTIRVNTGDGPMDVHVPLCVGSEKGNTCINCVDDKTRRLLLSWTPD